MYWFQWLQDLFLMDGLGEVDSLSQRQHLKVQLSGGKGYKLILNINKIHRCNAIYTNISIGIKSISIIRLRRSFKYFVIPFALDMFLALSIPWVCQWDCFFFKKYDDWIHDLNKSIFIHYKCTMLRPMSCSSIKSVFPGIGIPILKIRWSWDNGNSYTSGMAS